MTEYKTPNFSIDLSGQIALVTGASSGLGYRFSKVLASCGAKVAISARRKEKLESLAEEINKSPFAVIGLLFIIVVANAKLDISRRYNTDITAVITAVYGFIVCLIS